MAALLAVSARSKSAWFQPRVRYCTAGKEAGRLGSAQRGNAMRRNLSVVRLSAFVFVFTTAGLSMPAHARLTRINAGAPVLIDLPAFGRTGAYLKIAGTFEGELDPTDRRNALIADIDLAPKEKVVRYTSTFFVLRPVDLARGNAKLFYDFGNRANKRILQWFNDATESNDPSTPSEFGHGFLMRQGY